MRSETTQLLSVLRRPQHIYILVTLMTNAKDKKLMQSNAGRRKSVIFLSLGFHGVFFTNSYTSLNVSL
jgi:N-acetylmuramoyl-L-alanine amidase